MKCMYLSSVHLLGSYVLHQSQRSHAVFSLPSSSPPDVCFCMKRHWSILLQSLKMQSRPIKDLHLNIKSKRQPFFTGKLWVRKSHHKWNVVFKKLIFVKSALIWTEVHFACDLQSKHLCDLLHGSVSVEFHIVLTQQPEMTDLSKPEMLMKSNICVPFVCKYFKDTNKFHCLFMKHFRAVAVDRY